jgi:PAS domain S-box-containing protein
MNEKMTAPTYSDDFIKQIQLDNDYYRSIIENNSFYIIKTDLEGKYTYLNPFFCQRLGLLSEEWIGKPSLDLIIPEDHQVCIDTVEKCFANVGQSYWAILRKPLLGGIISTQWEFKILKGDDGAPNEMLSIGHDITPLIMKQQELQELVDVTAEQNKQLINFTYIISHNIRSHVANIIGIVELNDIDNEEDRAMTWELIKKSITSLDATIYNLNDIINIQSNTNFPIQTLVIKDEINRIIDSIEVLIRNENTKINYNFDDTSEVETNPAYLESIILNLFTNALKYKSPSRPLEIDISFYHSGNYKVFLFKDNGIGIDLNMHGDQVFGMYKTFHGNLDAKGLGLFIIKTQIEAMGGKIEVDSQLDHHTTFKVYFKDVVNW